MKATTILSLEERVECLLKDSTSSYTVRQLLNGLNINDDYEKVTRKDVLKAVQEFDAKGKLVKHGNDSSFRWRFGQA